jgi:hypothetical protein
MAEALRGAADTYEADELRNLHRLPEHLLMRPFTARRPGDHARRGARHAG